MKHPTSSVATILPKSLEIVNRLLYRPELSLVFSLDNDPLKINLPTYGTTGSDVINSENLSVMSVLYFQAELEQAGVIPVAELLTENRFSLQIRDAQAANKFEEFASQTRGQWYTRKLREQIFARTYGIGVQANNEAGVLINRDFEPLFGQTCYVLGRYQSQFQPSSIAGAYVTPVEIAFRNLIQNLNGRIFSNTLSASKRIQTQLQMAIDLLNHRGVTRLFESRNIWELIRNILGNDTPDLQRIISRAQSGLRIIGWMAENLAAIQGTGLESALFNESAVFSWASSWLHASGMAIEDNRSGYGNRQNAMFRYG